MVKRRSALLVTVSMAAVLAALPAVDVNASVTVPLRYVQSFETDMDSWTPASDHRERAFRINRSTAMAYHGATSLEYFLDGRNDDGTIWVQRPIKGLPPRTAVSVLATFWLHSPTKSDTNNWPVVSYAGASPPSAESDFVIVGLTDRVAGWAPYGKRVVANTDQFGNLWLAIGIGATWEVARTYHLDLFNIRVE